MTYPEDGLFFAQGWLSLTDRLAVLDPRQRLTQLPTKLGTQVPAVSPCGNAKSASDTLAVSIEGALGFERWRLDTGGPGYPGYCFPFVNSRIMILV